MRVQSRRTQPELPAQLNVKFGPRAQESRVGGNCPVFTIALRTAVACCLGVSFSKTSFNIAFRAWSARVLAGDIVMITVDSADRIMAVARSIGSESNKEHQGGLSLIAVESP